MRQEAAICQQTLQMSDEITTELQISCRRSHGK